MAEMRYSKVYLSKAIYIDGSSETLLTESDSRRQFVLRGYVDPILGGGVEVTTAQGKRFFVIRDHVTYVELYPEEKGKAK